MTDSVFKFMVLFMLMFLVLNVMDPQANPVDSTKGAVRFVLRLGLAASFAYFVTQ